MKAILWLAGDEQVVITDIDEEAEADIRTVAQQLAGRIRPKVVLQHHGREYVFPAGDLYRVQLHDGVDVVLDVR